MDASTSGCQAPGSWQWPDDQPATQPPPTTKSESTRLGPYATPGPEQQGHWPNRTCRICLEVVLPTFHPPTETQPGVNLGHPSVTYDSESGRLIRPCKCKGSSRYVHDSCLQQWRHADPLYGKRNFWQCPTCQFKYRLQRMAWSRSISSTAAQIFLTLFIFWVAVFALGFVADPLINLYIDPLSSVRKSDHSMFDDVHYLDEDDAILSWTEHFLKGFAGLGLLGAVKVFFSLGFWHHSLRNSGILGGGSRAGNTGRDRMANINSAVLLLGVGTVLWAVWKVVRAWSRRVLETAGERVADVQGDDKGDDD